MRFNTLACLSKSVVRKSDSKTSVNLKKASTIRKIVSERKISLKMKPAVKTKLLILIVNEAKPLTLKALTEFYYFIKYA